MADSTYVIVGGGMTAAAAVGGIREIDPAGTVTVFGAEPDPPYNRPPLSKDLWKEGSVDDIWRDETRDVDLRLGRRVVALNPEEKSVTDDRGQSLSFEKALLATGGTPRRLPFGGDDVSYFRTVADYRALREEAQPGRRFAVIGGGFIGSEIAAALRLHDVEVVMVFPGEGIGARIFPRPLCDAVTRAYRERGVDVRAGSSADGLERRNGALQLKIKKAKSGETTEVTVDGVVAGIGIEPNVGLSRDAGLEVADGIVVDRLLRTSRPPVYAAGDVAAFSSPALDHKRIRVEHEDAANTMGRTAGRNMAGHEEAYEHLPFFYSDLFDMGYEAVGITDSRLETVVDWKEPHREGVVYYMEGGRVRGVLLWNVWEKVDAARELIAETGPHTLEALKGRLA
jgi:NADPH-dependent 2,4-dienoyl-CoA reductase/sulfur reductase-like enzyme